MEAQDIGHAQAKLRNAQPRTDAAERRAEVACEPDRGIGNRMTQQAIRRIARDDEAASPRGVAGPPG